MEIDDGKLLRQLERYKERKKESVRKAVQKEKATRVRAERRRKVLAKVDTLMSETPPKKTGRIMEESELDDTIKPIKDLVQNNILFSPNAGPQTDFLAAPETDVLYGGAAGGGKSFAMIVDPLRYAHIKDHRALILRKTLPELRELIDKTRELYPQAFPGAKYKETEKIWKFPSGASVEFGYLEKDADVYRYQGQAFTWIGFDEITHLATEFPWNYLGSRLRTTNPEIICYMRCTDEGEVLTDKGWVAIQDVRVGDSVYALEWKGEMGTTKVSNVFAVDADEELVRVRKKNLYMSFTKDHQLAYYKHGTSKLRIQQYSEIKGKSICVARSATKYHAKGYKPPFDIDPLVFCRLLGIYVAEGSTPTPRKGNYKVLVTQTQEHKAQAIRTEIFEKLPYNFCYSGGDFQITNKALYEWLKPLGKAHEKYIPQEFLATASQEQLEEFFKWYMYGDGHWQTATS